MKKIVVFMMSLVGLFALVFGGCNNNKKEAFSITDIVWSVEEKLFKGENTIVFSYKNNSKYTIIGVNIEFRQKDNLSEEELSILEKYSDVQSDLSNIYITADNYYFTKSNKNSNIVPCNLIGSWNYCRDIEEYNLMKPTKLSVAYIKDDKMFGVEYEFENNKTKNLSEDGKSLFEWTENQAKDLIPKPNKEVVKKSFDYEGMFCFSIWDATEEDFNDYVEKCKEKGFTINIDDSDYFDYKSFKAEDANGNQLHIYYKSQDNHREPCRIEVEIDY